MTSLLKFLKTVEWWKVIKGGLIAAGGATIAYFTTVFTGFAAENPDLAIVITAVCGFLLNGAKKLLDAWAATT